jgi:hypothetical protein
VGSLVRYDFDGSVARITMDDGKVNVLSQEMLAELNEALSRAEADAAIHDGPRGDQAAGQEAGACGHSRGHSARVRFLCRVTAFR